MNQYPEAIKEKTDKFNCVTNNPTEKQNMNNHSQRITYARFSNSYWKEKCKL
jgi:hypothetical protein